jgi:hypothetical protein
MEPSFSGVHMDKKLISAIWICLALTFTGCAFENRHPSAPPEKTFVHFAEGITPAGDHEDPEIASSINREPGSAASPARGIPVDAMAVHPRRVQIQVGEVFSLKKLIITALDSNGKPVRDAPFTAEVEATEPPILEIRKDHPELLKGLRPGKADIRFVGRVARPDGTYPAVYFTVYIRR